MVIQQYEDPKVNKYLKWGYWYKDHAEQIKKATTLSVLTLVSIVWIIFFFNAYEYIAGRSANSSIASDMSLERIDYQTIHSLQSPDDLILGDVNIFASGENLADFAVSASNPNQNWLIELEYSFVWSEGETVSKRLVVFPRQQTILISQGASVNSLPDSATIRAEIVKWQRIKNQATLDFLEEVRSNINFSNLEVLNQDDFTGANYTVTNNTLYTIIEPSFLVLARDFSGEIAAAGINSTNSIMSKQSVDLEFRWLYDLPFNLELEIIPLIDFLDSSAYELGEDQFKF